MKQPLKIAVQKKGRLSEQSIALLRSCGLSISNTGGLLKENECSFGAEILYLRDDDIPHYVENGIADIGILGQNTVWEKRASVDEILPLGFAQCRLSIAIPANDRYNGTNMFSNKKIATSYPSILSSFLDQKGVNAQIEEISGSVEIATGIGLADAVCDIVSSGSTLRANGLKEVETVLTSEAVLIANRSLNAEKSERLAELVFRIEAVVQARDFKYILLNAPFTAVDEIARQLPSMKSPTILPLAEAGWCSMHSVVSATDFWKVIGRIKALGAEGILVSPINTLVR